MADPGAARRPTTPPAAPCHDAEHAQEPERQAAAGSVREREQRDQHRRTIDEVVAVQGGAGRPLVGEHQQAALIGTERLPREREPGQACRDSQCDDPRCG